MARHQSAHSDPLGHRPHQAHRPPLGVEEVLHEEAQYVGQTVQIDRHLANAVGCQQPQGVGHQGKSANRHGGLGSQLRERPQTGSESGRHDHRAHGVSGSDAISSASGVKLA